jgi:methionyl-tRNA formyltransferase
MKNNEMNTQLKNLIIFLVAILIGILLGISFIYLSKKKSNYYAVFLNNGAIYFGKLSTFPKLKLSDAIFLQFDQQGQASFQNFKDAFWRPKGPIYLNQNSILFIAPLDENSPLVNLIESFPKGILNVHPSLLPKYRGPNPIREVILNGEKETGVTIFLIDELIDHGPILKQEKIEIWGYETYLELEEKLGKLGGKVLREIIIDYLDGKLKAIPQDEKQATYTKKISKEDGFLSFDEGYEIWQRKIRALNPWPSTYIKVKSQKSKVKSENDFLLLKIFKIEKLEEKSLPKEILKKNVGEFFVIKNDLGLRLKDAFVILKEVQLEGRKKMSGREFLNGFRKILNIN